MSAKKKRQPAGRKARSRETPAAAIPTRNRVLALLWDSPVLALVLTAAVYARCVGNAFVYDDNELVVINSFIGDWAMVWKSFVNDSWWFRNPLKLPQSAYYRPLWDVWLALNYHLFGLNPAPWHLTSLAVHLAAVWLVFEVARDLTAHRWTPLLAATLFGVMPVHAQAVVWPAAIPLPMSTVFELAAFLCFIRGRRPRNEERRDHHRRGRHGGGALTFWAIAFYALALLSHELAVVFPLIVVAYIVILAPDETGQPAVTLRRRSIDAALRAWPFFAELAGYLVLRLWILGFISRSNVTNPMTIAQEIVTLPAAIGLYLMLLIAPWNAAPVHLLNVVFSPWSRAFFLPLLGVALLLSAAMAALWNTAHRRLYLFCGVWIAVALLPVLDLRAFVPFALVEDRYAYMASVAWCLAVADVTVAALEGTAVPIAMFAAVGAMLSAVYAGYLFHIESFWHDDVALFSACIRISPGSSLCHDRLGLAFKKRGDIHDAERELRIAQAINPDDGANLYNLGLLEAQLGRSAQGIGELQRALTLMPDAPPGPYIELARIADLSGDAAARDAALAHAATLKGGADAVDVGRAELMLIHQDFAGAEVLMRALVARDPDNPDAWTLLGSALAHRGKMQEALDAYRKALAIRPSDNLTHAIATMHSRLGRGLASAPPALRPLAEPAGANATAGQKENPAPRRPGF